VGDARLEAFRGLIARQPADTIVIEGELAVARALQAGAPIETILATAAHAERIDPKGADLVVLDKEALASLLGFPFHRGVVAAMPRPASSLDRSIFARPRSTVVVTTGLADPANVGAIIRTARAFAIDLVVTDSDPWTRKAIRASAGLVFDQTLWHVPRIDEALDALEPHTQLVACTPAPMATPLPDYARPRHVAFLFGSEAAGLPASLLARAAVHLRIPLVPGVDSLNVTAAAAIILHAKGGQCGPCP
jgi:tRNA G18 (ribose-2'-O)-methylase SpoU